MHKESAMSFLGEYTLKRFEANSKSNWPLPPSSVFKCKPATPWLDPNLFHVDHTYTPLAHQSGVLVVGDVLPEVAQEQQMNEIFSEYEYPSSTASNLVKLQCRRSVEYSDNPERGIDLGDAAANKGERFSATPRRINFAHTEQSEKVRRADSGRIGTDKAGKPVDRSNSQTRKKRMWSPFQRNRGQQWKLLY